MLTPPIEKNKLFLNGYSGIFRAYFWNLENELFQTQPPKIPDFFFYWTLPLGEKSVEFSTQTETGEMALPHIFEDFIEGLDPMRPPQPPKNLLFENAENLPENR